MIPHSNVMYQEKIKNETEESSFNVCSFNNCSHGFGLYKGTY